jgi:hypothetical protein
MVVVLYEIVRRAVSINRGTMPMHFHPFGAGRTHSCLRDGSSSKNIYKTFFIFRPIHKFSKVSMQSVEMKGR